MSPSASSPPGDLSGPAPPPAEPVLEPVAYGCLQGAATVRVTRGCDLGCTFCWARGYEPGPAARDLSLVEDLLDRLGAELDDPEASSPRPEHVLVSPEVDALPADLAVQDVVHRVFRALLDRRIGLSFTTKGVLTRRFLELVAANPGRIWGRVVVPVLDAELARRLEPGAADPEDRLDTAAALAELGALAGLRIDPLLPFVTDSDEQLGALLRSIARRGLDRAVVSYVHLRPGIQAELLEQAPPAGRELLREAFRDQPWVDAGTGTKVRLLPRSFREENHRRIRRLGERAGVELEICSCKNPDLTGVRCGDVEGRVFPTAARRGPPGEVRRPLVSC